MPHTTACLEFGECDDRGHRCWALQRIRHGLELDPAITACRSAEASSIHAFPLTHRPQGIGQIPSAAPPLVEHLPQPQAFKEDRIFYQNVFCMRQPPSAHDEHFFYRYGLYALSRIRCDSAGDSGIRLALVMQAREAAGREASPTAGMIDIAEREDHRIRRAARLRCRQENQRPQAWAGDRHDRPAGRGGCTSGRYPGSGRGGAAADLDARPLAAACVCGWRLCR
jgi:hypothetical protein